MNNRIIEIPLDKILPATSMLRPVRENTLEFMELVDSIRAVGLLKSLLVREHPTRSGYFEIIDGMWRFSALKHLTNTEVPCILVVEDLTAEQYMAMQVQANAVSYETRPIEFAEQMQRMLTLREEVGAPMTLRELAKVVGKSSDWVSKRLKLLSLCSEAQELIRSGKLGIGKAIALARIRFHPYQREFLDKAPDVNTREFELEVGRFISGKREEKTGERRDDRDEIKLRPKLQSMDSMLIELDRMDNISEIIVRNNLTTAIEGAKVALEWALHLHAKGRELQMRELRFKLSKNDRLEILRRQRYEELKEIEEMTKENLK